ncbi:hypothetical protein M6D81_19770 [Paenibacillus sp. J5C_2022]|uniref:hypothetical protein n=1 Tax=Paenibacillus sp. J5C2022 TaxID=2977129 RepID=UPI0021D2804A|nr:hypothetical protein [Paenibacillus sp. J5C2022]MCU6710938.1 hypothetical protein [Paenibacillus sp. J5C2022]
MNVKMVTEEVEESSPGPTGQEAITVISSQSMNKKPMLLPKHVDAIDRYFIKDYDPYVNDDFHFIIRWQTNKENEATSDFIPFCHNIGEYTGVAPAGSLEKVQRGMQVPGNPLEVSGFQLFDTTGGSLMNSWQTPYREIKGGGQNVVFGYAYSEGPFLWRGRNSGIILQGEMQVPYFQTWKQEASTMTPVGQLSYIVYMLDTTTDITIAMVINAFDNREQLPKETVMHDTFVSFVSTHFSANRYITPVAESAGWRNKPNTGFELFAAAVTAGNISMIAEDINHTHQQQLSLNAADYCLKSVGILQETFRKPGDQVAMGMSFKDFSLYSI